MAAKNYAIGMKEVTSKAPSRYYILAFGLGIVFGATMEYVMIKGNYCKYSLQEGFFFFLK